MTGYTGDFAGSVYMQTLQPNGKTDKTYFWADLAKDPEDPESVAYYGWYDEEDQLATKTINAGDGFWTASDSSEYKIQSAGKVLATSVAIALGGEGCIMIANPHPTTVDIQKVAVTGYDGDFGGSVYMQTLQPNGKTDKTYFWADLAKDPEDPESVAYYGWYDEEDKLVTKTIEVGEGFWTASDSTAYSIEFPALGL